MKCKNCDNAADPTLGTGIYCSRSCANKRTHSPETKQKISRGVTRTGAVRGPLSSESLTKWKKSISAHYERLYQSKTFDELGFGQQRRRIIEEQNGCCADCGISEWKSKPIILEIDHKDGNNQNNSRENLWAICPNCHSVTESWRGRNKPRFNGEVKVTDEELSTALQTEPTIRQALLKVGLAAKGGNYTRAKKLLAMLQNPT
jgi:5-methylcytosine-specific restriction endonuclease McrA